MNETARSPRPLVAIIDDEEDIITFLSLALDDRGCDVVSTSRSSKALSLLTESSPDLVFLDLLMPERTGVSLYSEIVRHPAIHSCPIVIMSGLGERREIEQILARAGDVPPPAAIIEKPIDVASLVAVVNAHLFGKAEAHDSGGPATGGGP